MNVREALEKTRGERFCVHEGYDDRCHNCTAWLVRGEVYADLAPVIERALRAERTAGYLAGFRCANDGGLSDETAHKWAEAAGKGELTAGIAAMMEES